ncbi:MAG: ATP-binding cassette domain-containing protein [Bacteroidales bacterium]|nr:ATP-binding cassette domain-containing protein [Bacteroidales bacterium]
MSEAILDALIQLFALIVDVDEENIVSEREKEVIRSFLTQQLNSELAQKYMVIFEEYLLLFHKADYYQDSSKKEKRKHLAGKKICDICEKMNEELQLSQKIFVVIQLIEFISLGEVISKKESDFLESVARTFRIPDNEYWNIFNFIVGTINDIPERDKILVVNNTEKCKYEDVKHKYDPNISGELYFLRIESTKTYVLRYSGYADIYLNSQNIVSGRTYSFEHGSSVRSPTLNTIFFTDVVGMFSEIFAKDKISVTAKDVSFWFKNTQNGIQKFNMHARSGTLVAVMGGSGVGKSTLINVLNGNLKPDRGEVYFNGYNLNDLEERKKIKGIIGLVPQEDLLIEDLTVHQNLYFSAKLCLDDLDDVQIEEVVDRVLDELDLKDIKHLKVGSPLKKIISGGQRKRLNIALELIREPSVLFIDEPTSGLSSVDAENVMNLLKEQTDNGKLVIANIHQPSSYLYKMFDEILILDKGGYEIFYGNPMEAIVYFKRMSRHANPDEDQCALCGHVNTDQMLQIIDAKVINEHGKLTNNRKVSPEEWSKLFDQHIWTRQKPVTRKERIPESNLSIPNKIKQTILFFTRDLISKVANSQYLLITLLEAPLLALIMGYFTKYIKTSYDSTGEYIFYYNENLPAYIFMCVIVSLFLGLIVSSEEIIKDRKILKRESFLNLSRVSYLNSKVLLLFILSAIQTLSFVAIGNLILEIKGMTASYWLILFSTSCFANMLGLNISAGFDRVITVYVLIPFLLIPQLLFSGVIVKFDKLHKYFTNFDYVPVIGDIMTSRWAYEALSVHQFKDDKYQTLIYDSERAKSQYSWYYGELEPELNKKTQECSIAFGKDEYRDHFENNLYKLRKYVGMLSARAGIDNDDLIEKYNREDFDTAVARLSLERLGTLRQYFLAQFLKARDASDSTLSAVENQYGHDYLQTLKFDYHNENLENFCLNLRSTDRIIETREKIIQKTDPVYMMPTSNYGRAQFYAPCKILGNIHIDTYWFNLMAIWLLTLIFYVTLYTDLLRKTINYFGRVEKI